MPTTIATRYRLPPTSTKLSRAAERVARAVLQGLALLIATAALGAACLVIGLSSL
jgi:hypothetical protein